VPSLPEVTISFDHPKERDIEDYGAEEHPQLLQTVLDAIHVRGLAEFCWQFLGLIYRPADEQPVWMDAPRGGDGHLCLGVNRDDADEEGTPAQTPCAWRCRPSCRDRHLLLVLSPGMWRRVVPGGGSPGANTSVTSSRSARREFAPNGISRRRLNYRSSAETVAAP
jgi:hypothetical protein